MSITAARALVYVMLKRRIHPFTSQELSTNELRVYKLTRDKPST